MSSLLLRFAARVRRMYSAAIAADTTTTATAATETPATRPLPLPPGALPFGRDRSNPTAAEGVSLLLQDWDCEQRGSET